MDSTLSHKFKLSAENKIEGTSTSSLKEDTSLHAGQVNQPAISTFKELTTIRTDEEEKIDEVCKGMKFASPFENVTPSHVLRRMYKVLDQTCTSGTSINFNVTNLFKYQESLKRVLTMFGLARFDIRVRILINAIPQQYGLVLFGSVPWAEATSAADQYEIGSANPVLLDVASSQSFETILPYNAPMKFLPINASTASTYDIYIPTFMWSMHLNTYFSTTDPTVDQSIGIQVWMGLENVEVAAPLPVDYYHPNETFARKGKGFTEQSGDQSGGFFRNAMVGTGLGAAASTFKTYYDMYTNARGAGSEAFKAAKTVKEDFDGAKNFFKEYVDEDITPEEIVGPESGGQESVKMNPWGDMSTAIPDPHVSKMTLNGKTGLMDKSWCGDPSDGSHSIQQVCGKPALVQVEELTTDDIFGGRVDPNFALYNQSVGTNPIGYVKSPTYASYLSRIFRYWRGGFKIFFSFHTSPLIMARIRVCLKYQLNDTTGDFIAAPGTGAVFPGDIYTETITVRGSTTYELGVPYLAHQPWTPCYLESGFTAVTGYADPRCYTFPYVMVHVDDIIQTMGSNSSIVYMAVSFGVAEDFEFRQLISYVPNVQPEGFKEERKEKDKGVQTNNSVRPQAIKPRIIEEQCDINKIFSQPFKNPFGKSFVVDQFAIGTDRVKTLEHCLRRYGFVDTLNPEEGVEVTYQPKIIVLGSVDPDSQIKNHDWIVTLFKWWRGSVNLKGRFEVSGTSAVDTFVSTWVANKNPYPLLSVPFPQFLNQISNGAVGTPVATWGNIDVEVPFYYPYPVASIHDNPGLVAVMPDYEGVEIMTDDFAHAGAAKLKLFNAAGKDYQLFYQMPVPVLGAWPR